MKELKEVASSAARSPWLTQEEHYRRTFSALDPLFSNILLEPFSFFPVEQCISSESGVHLFFVLHEVISAGATWGKGLNQLCVWEKTQENWLYLFPHSTAKVLIASQCPDWNTKQIRLGSFIFLSAIRHNTAIPKQWRIAPSTEQCTQRPTGPNLACSVNSLSSWLI